jgi:hypothetical protein
VRGAGRRGVKVTASGTDVRTTVLMLVKAKRVDRHALHGLTKGALASENVSLIGTGNALQPIVI